MKVTPRLPMHLPGVDPQQFPELRYFRFEQQSVWAAALFGFFEEFRLPRFQSQRLQKLAIIHDRPDARLCRFLLDPKTNAENMLAAWNCGPELIPLVLESARVITNAASATPEDICQAIHAIIPIVMQPSEQLPENRYSPVIYVLYHGTDWAALLYTYHAPESYSLTDCGHIALKVNVFADARKSMQKPLHEKEMVPEMVRCRKCDKSIGSGIFALGKKAAQTYPHDLPRRLFSHFTSGTELPVRTVGRSCAYCNSERGSLTCFGGCNICAWCAVLASCSQVYFLRCPACGDRFSKAVCAGIMEELPKTCSWGVQELQKVLECDHCHGCFSFEDIAEVSHDEKTLFICPNCKPNYSRPEQRCARHSFQSRTSVEGSVPFEELKERGCKCANCGTISNIQDFTFYLSNRHNCMMCDLCYYQFLVADTMLSMCPGCNEPFASQGRDSYLAVRANPKLPSIYCDICEHYKHESMFSGGSTLSHWWKCRVCDACLSHYESVGHQVCGVCKDPYTIDDQTILQRFLNSLRRQPSNTATALIDDRPKCDLCLRPSSNFSIMRGGQHRCKICDGCLEAVIDSNWDCACPVCGEPAERGSLTILQDWREKRNWLTEMNTVATCVLCCKTKPRKEMLKWERLHHSCVVCDACLVRRLSLAACPACAAPYQEPNLTISAKLIRKKCPTCDKFIRDTKPKCPNTCFCSLCLLEDFALSNVNECYECHNKLEGRLPVIMTCDGCLRQLYVAKSQDTVFGICEGSCVLCCFCIRIKNGEAYCTQCGKHTEIQELETIVKLQKDFKLGCYCGKNEGRTITLPCSHEVHNECQPLLLECRLCGQKYQRKQRSYPLDIYVT